MRSNSATAQELKQDPNRVLLGEEKPTPLPSPKVAAYVRVSVACDHQQTSFELQKQHYETMIQRRQNRLRDQ